MSFFFSGDIASTDHSAIFRDQTHQKHEQIGTTRALIKGRSYRRREPLGYLGFQCVFLDAAWVQ